MDYAPKDAAAIASLSLDDIVWLTGEAGKSPAVMGIATRAWESGQVVLSAPDQEQVENELKNIISRNTAIAMLVISAISVLAGFVEAGESAEESLVREIEEESGVRIAALEYVGSQAWPYPRSLMLGYLASTDNSEAARPDGSEIIDVRWFEPDEIARALADDGDVTLPGPSSISRALIERWLERVTDR